MWNCLLAFFFASSAAEVPWAAAFRTAAWLGAPRRYMAAGKYHVGICFSSLLLALMIFNWISREILAVEILSSCSVRLFDVLNGIVLMANENGL